MAAFILASLLLLDEDDEVVELDDQNRPSLLCLPNLQESLQDCCGAVKSHIRPPNARILDCSSRKADFHPAQIDQKWLDQVKLF